jgi:poly-gamma-glutamate synthesis protein (capsule biosynthesis protein)
MKRRRFLKGLRDGLLLLPGSRVLGTPATERREYKQAVNGLQQVKLLLTGDVMTGRGIDQILMHPGEPFLHELYVSDAREYVRLAERKNGPIPESVDSRYIWGQALEVLGNRQPDLRIINLETSVTTSNHFWPTKGIHYRMHPRNVSCLTAAGIDCCVLANNHVLDWGHSGLEETLATLHKAGLSTAGAGRNFAEATRPARFRIVGQTDIMVFAFADTSSGVPKSWRADDDRGGVNVLDDLSARTAEQIAEHITSQRQDGEIVIASIHWGDNWGYEVPSEQQRFAHYLIDRGSVDVVHGHSSHHAKAIEIYRGKPILYGCGDFLNDYEGIGGEERYRPWLAPMYFVTIDAISRLLIDIEILPMQLQRFRLITATMEDRQWLNETLNKVSENFGTAFESSGSSLLVSTSSL